MLQISPGQAEHKLDHRFERGPGFGFWTAALCVAGSARIQRGASAHVRRAPSLTLIEPQTPYVTTFGGAGRRWREYWAIFSIKPEWSRLLAWPTAMPGVHWLDLARSPLLREIRAAFDDLCRFRAWPAEGRTPLLINALERLLLLADAVNPSRRTQPIDPRVQQAMQVLCSRVDQPMSVATLARMVHLSPSHLAHRFTRDVGEPPMRYFERQKIARAQDLLLSTNLPIHEVARQLGFDNPFHFSARFRRWTGASPRAFRKQPQ